MDYRSRAWPLVRVAAPVGSIPTPCRFLFILLWAVARAAIGPDCKSGVIATSGVRVPHCSFNLVPIGEVVSPLNLAQMSGVRIVHREPFDSGLMVGQRILDP